ncbi:hypothetical protein JCM19236_4895 [Vibrio sp. JCM 19236]|nr:hypothetical protein JCM19236_4895 [Vibrio sp. JCM 19236]
MIKLEQVAEIRAGHPFRGSINEDLSGNGCVIQIRDQSIDGNIAWESLTKTEIKGRKEPEWLKEDDVVFSARGNRNLASVVPLLETPTVCSPHYFQIRTFKEAPILPEFLAWQLNQATVQRYFEQSAEGSVQSSIRRAVLEKTPLSVPSIKKQKQILNMIKAADREKEIYQKLIDLRRSEVNTVAKHILTQSKNKRPDNATH